LKLFSLLGFKLFVLILTILLVAFAGILFLNLGIHRSHLVAGKIEEARSTADVIRNAIHDNMLQNQSSTITGIITNIGRGEGIEGIRIYNKRGEIIHTSRPAERLQVVDTRAEACVSCHGGEGPIESPPTDRLHRIYDTPGRGRILGWISPIPNEPSCSEAACHYHPPDKKVLGVLDVRMSLAKLDGEIASSSRAMLLWAAGIVFIAALASGAFIRRMVHRPVSRLMQGTEEVAKGNLGYRIGTRSKDEIGRLAASFDSMAADLGKARDEITAWSQTLEGRVREKSAELERARERMVQAEKMASLGKLAATVAHELNNPLAGILTYAKLVGRRLERDPGNAAKIEESLKDLGIVEAEARRCGNIINDLLLFAKGGHGEVRTAGVREIVERALAVVRHHLEIRGIRPEFTGPDGSETIRCDPDQIIEALVALFVNAAEAMPDGGSLTVRAERRNGTMRLEVTDTGCGIPPEALSHIFEPFYTTKEEGKSLGLGLAVVYGIIGRHGGRIAVDSKPGAGTTFRITLPAPAAEPPAEGKSGEEERD
jgi:two-component system NtrC family sensor kinase